MDHHDKPLKIREFLSLLERYMAKLADTVVTTSNDVVTLTAAVANLQTELDAVKAIVTAIQVPEAVNLQPIETALAAIQDELTPSAPATPAT